MNTCTHGKDIGRPSHLCMKIWHMIQSNNTKSENLENDFTEILEKTHLLGWNETTKSIRCWVDKEEDESAWSCSGERHQRSSVLVQS